MSKPFVFEVTAAREFNLGAGESSETFHRTVRSALLGAGRYYPLSPTRGRVVVEDELEHTHAFIRSRLGSHADLIAIGVTQEVDPEQAPYISGHHPNALTLRPREGETLYPHAVRAVVSQYPEAEFVPDGPTGGGTVSIYHGDDLQRYMEVRNAIGALGVLENASYETPVVLPKAASEPPASPPEAPAEKVATDEQAKPESSAS